MHRYRGRILLVDDEEGILVTVGDLLRREGYDVETAATFAEAHQTVGSLHFDLALVDLHLGDESGMDLIKIIREVSPTTAVAVFTGSPDIPSAIEAVRLGAVDYITKPMRFETILAVTRHALNVKRLAEDRDRYRSNLETILSTVPDGIILVDVEGKLLHANDRSREHCGYTVSDMGKILPVHSPRCNAGCRELLREVLEKGEQRVLRRVECRRQGHKSRIVTITVTPVRNPHGMLRGAVAVIHDDTDLVALEKRAAFRSSFHGIVGSSPPMQRLFSLVEALQDTPATVLITGETGTGKELVARAIHEGGSRKGKPFLAVNCAALPEQLLESELFGHERGAFTGALTDRMGRFESAAGGTLFLDEIGEMSPHVQTKLLRVLQDGSFERVGSSITRRADVRVIAATNRNLEEMVADGRFRGDLYWRLKVVRITIPPLRERRDDIPLLVRHFVDRFNRRYHRTVEGVSDDVMRLFLSHPFPGNVRELEHVIEHAFVLCGNGLILPSHLPEEYHGEHHSEARTPLSGKLSSLSIGEALSLSGGNKSRAARLLGVSRRTLYRHLEADGGPGIPAR